MLASGTKFYRREKLKKGEEWRFGVGDAKTVRVWLIRGSAEVFGSELKRIEVASGGFLPFKLCYEFRNCHAAVYTLNGCVLAICGKTEYDYVTGDTPMCSYQNYNAALTNVRRFALLQQITAEVKRETAIGGSGVGSAKPALRIPETHEECDKLMHELALSCGPKVAVLGPQNSGKATVCRILANYSVRSGFGPLLVDLDTSLSIVSLPGCVAALSVSQPMSPNLGFNHTLCSDRRDTRATATSSSSGTAPANASANASTSASSAMSTAPMTTITIPHEAHSGGRGPLEIMEADASSSSTVPVPCSEMADGSLEPAKLGGDGRRDGREEPSTHLPLVYFVGHSDPRKCLDLYLARAKQLALRVKQRLAASEWQRAAGLIIRLPSWLTEVAHRSALDAVIRMFCVDTCLVIQHDLSMIYLRAAYGRMATEMLTKSGGVIDRGAAKREAERRRLVNAYFYGPFGDYMPASRDLCSEALAIFMVTKPTSSMLLPVGEDSAIRGWSALPARRDASVTRHVLAILSIDSAFDKDTQQIRRDLEPTADEIAASNVIGFAHMTECDSKSKRALVLAPDAFVDIPTKCLLKGAILWSDR